MLYKQRLNQLTQKLQAKDLQTERLFESDAWSWAFTWYLILKQSNYLLWTVFSLGIQICEILILAKVYFIYFPPESLSVLRVISATTFLGVFSAFTIRVLENSPLVFSSANSKTNLIVDMAKVFFNVCLVISFTLVMHIAFRTNLNFTAPTILRAVILAGIVALPFDCINTFLFYNLRNFSTPWKAENLRSFSIVSQVIALVCLFYDWPLVFLVTKTLPRLITFSLLWKNCTKLPLRGVLNWTAKSKERTALKKLFLATFCGPFSIFIAGEIPLFLLFTKLTRMDSNMGVTLFFIHKLVHVLALLSIKAFFNLSFELETTRSAKDLIGFERGKKRLAFARVVYSVATLGLAPLVLMKSELIFWLSPVGVRFSWSISTLLIATLLVIVHSAWTGEALGFTNKNFKTWWALVVLTCSVVLSKIGAQFGKGASTSLEVGQIFLTLGLIDLIFLATLRAGLTLLFGSFSKKEKEISTQATLHDLVDEMTENYPQNSSQEQALLFVEFDKNISKEVWGPKHSRGIAKRLGDDEKLVQIGRNSCLILLTAQEKSQILLKVEEHIHRYAGLINKVQLEFVQWEEVGVTLKKVFKCDRVDLAFFRSFSSRNHNIKNIPEHLLTFHSELLKKLNCGSEDDINFHPDLTIVTASKKWPVYQVDDKKKRKELYQYLKALHSSNDKVLPEINRSKASRYCYHLNQGVEPKLVVRVNEPLKHEAYLLKFLALRHNLVEMGLTLEPLEKNGDLVRTLEAA